MTVTMDDVMEAARKVVSKPMLGITQEGGKNLTNLAEKILDESDEQEVVRLANKVLYCNIMTENFNIGSEIGQALLELNNKMRDAGVLKNPKESEMAVKSELKDMKARDEQAEKDAKFTLVSVVNQGDKIIIPENMSPGKAIEWLERRQKEDESKIAVYEPIEGHPLDGVHALMQALKTKYGWAESVPTPGFFGSDPPTMIGVESAPGKTVQVVWGRIQIPSISGHLETSYARKDGRFIFALAGEVKKKHQKDVAEIAELTRKYVKEHSLYKGKAIRVNSFVDNPRDFNPIENAPRFIDTSKTNDAAIVLNEDVMAQVIDSVFVPIEFSRPCRKLGIPLKRGVLLSGPYGVGKSLCASITAKKCQDNGWTFIYVGQTSDLKQAILFARQYQPAVVFAEDIDRAVEGQDRTEDIDGILNTLDGVDTKNTELLVILTTNHIEKINKAMLRPGRLDAVITLPPPDAVSVERLIRMYGGVLVEDIGSLEEVGTMLAGQIPAVIEEVVKRAKLSAISRGFTGKLEGADLIRAAKGMLVQVKLVTAPPKVEEHPAVTHANWLRKELAEAVSSNGDE